MFATAIIKVFYWTRIAWHCSINCTSLENLHFITNKLTIYVSLTLKKIKDLDIKICLVIKNTSMHNDFLTPKEKLCKNRWNQINAGAQVQSLLCYLKRSTMLFITRQNCLPIFLLAYIMTLACLLFQICFSENFQTLVNPK